ncbi:hypothetical protein [Flagellimonas onchidii]|uniref:hypothetical protein n=1 Tax=Flagellimonas onchidii TaxID=2562684 RepID=UPI0010A62A0E|nr:hypothetical protein [Allomuricauda onchidii]
MGIDLKKHVTILLFALMFLVHGLLSSQTLSVGNNPISGGVSPDGAFDLPNNELSIGTQTTNGDFENVLNTLKLVGSHVVNIASDTSYDHEIGTVLWFTNNGDGGLTIQPDSGVTGFNAFSVVSPSTVLLRKNGADSWEVLGTFGATSQLYKGLSYSSVNSDYTITSRDFDVSEKREIVVSSASDVTITVNDVATEGESVIISNKGTGTVFVVEGTADINAEGGDAFQIARYGYVKLVRYVADYQPRGTWSAYTPVPPATYTIANAVNPNDEADSTTGFTVGANATLATSTGTVDNGTYSLHVQITNTSAVNTEIKASTTGVVNGDNVTITYRVYRGQSGNAGNYFARLQTGDGWVSSDQDAISNGDTGVWSDISLTATASQDNPDIQIMQSSTVSGVNDMYFDNLVITKN